MPFVSAVIITLNEQKNIARAIKSLKVADETVVVDSGSTDRTCDIAASLGARVIDHSWGGFAAQKNFAAAQATNDWILALDADEALDEDAQRAVERWKGSDPASAGYGFRRRAYYLGKWILHSGWYPDIKVRLYDRRRGRWTGDFVHESVAVDGPVEILTGEILHYTCDSLKEHRERVEYYTGLAAAEMHARGEFPGWFRRQCAPIWTFTQSYFLRRGFLDGAQGFWIAWMASRYVAKKHAKAAVLAEMRD